MTRQVLTSDMVAHVWAQPVRDRQSYARTKNGNFYFEGRTLYSYGPHFVVGWQGDKVTLLNSSRYSVTTSGHKMDARCAVVGRYVEIANLTDVAGHVEDIERANAWAVPDAKAAIKRFVARTWAEQSPEGRQILAQFGGFTRSLAKMGREHAAALARAAKKEAAEKKWELRADVSQLLKTGPADVERWLEDTIESAFAGGINNWSVNNVAGEIRKRDRRALGALKFANANDYGKRTIRHLQAIRRALKSALSGLQTRVDIYTAQAPVKLAIDAMRAAIAMHKDPLGARRAYGESLFTGKRNAVPVSDRWLLDYDETHFGDGETWETVNRESAQLLFHLASGPLVESPYCPSGLAEKLAAGYAEFRPTLEAIRTKREANMQAAQRRREEARQLEEAEKLKRWLAGDSAVRWHGTDGNGGARLRARHVVRDESGIITGGTLDTSQGADVPLVEAVQIYRRVALCKARGVSWRRNGEKIRVGHFFLDSIAADGSFRAGCHRFNWDEVHRVAAELGIA